LRELPGILLEILMLPMVFQALLIGHDLPGGCATYPSAAGVYSPKFLLLKG